MNGNIGCCELGAPNDLVNELNAIVLINFAVIIFILITSMLQWLYYVNYANDFIILDIYLFWE